jgi:hypothetical protein
MVKNNSLVASIWENFLKGFKQFQKKYRNFSLKYPNTSQTIQLSFIYFFAILLLIHKNYHVSSIQGKNQTATADDFFLLANLCPLYIYLHESLPIQN